MSKIKVIMAIALACLGLSQAQQGCRVRPEVRDMTPQQIRDLIQAIRQVHRTTRSQRFQGYSRWDEFARIHAESFPRIHVAQHFFTWHRYFLWEVESELRRVNPNVVIPYWDWTYDAANPAQSVVMRSDWFGPATQSGCVRQGNFANFQLRYPRNHCLDRKFNRTATWTSRGVLNQILRNSRSYNDLYNAINIIPHGIVHVTIGGGFSEADAGDMATGGSPNDPLFFLHHAMIDKTWEDWQRLGRTDYPYNRRQTLPVYQNVRVSDLLDTRQGRYCVRYAPPRAIVGRAASNFAASNEPSMTNASPTTNNTTWGGNNNNNPISPWNNNPGWGNTPSPHNNPPRSNSVSWNGNPQSAKNPWTRWPSNDWKRQGWSHNPRRNVFLKRQSNEYYANDNRVDYFNRNRYFNGHIPGRYRQSYERRPYVFRDQQPEVPPGYGNYNSPLFTSDNVVLPSAAFTYQAPVIPNGPLCELPEYWIRMHGIDREMYQRERFEILTLRQQVAKDMQRGIVHLPMEYTLNSGVGGITSTENGGSAYPVNGVVSQERSTSRASTLIIATANSISVFAMVSIGIFKSLT
jgi:tyrosinase